VDPHAGRCEESADVKAAERCFLDKSGRLIDPIYLGRYRPGTWTPGTEPQITDAEMKIIAEPLDFFGFNCYGGMAVRHNAKRPADGRRSSTIQRSGDADELGHHA